jgi:hypothetical protein
MNIQADAVTWYGISTSTLSLGQVWYTSTKSLRVVLKIS